MFLGLVCLAQSKVTPVTQSTILGVDLPSGSTQDKRLLVVAAGRATLEMVAKDLGTTLINEPEILTLPWLAGKQIELDLLARLKASGWTSVGVPNQSSYYKLTRNKDHVLIYLFTTKKDTQLYVSGLAAPTLNTDTQVAESNVTETNATKTENPPVIQQEVVKTNEVRNPGSGAYTFTTTNFDDGWVSTVKADWVEVTKSNVKVLIHFQKNVTDESFSNVNESMTLAWNNLVAPRYSDLRNYYIAPRPISYEPGHLQSGTVTDNQTRKTVFVVLFFKRNSGWLEFIAPDEPTFRQVLGFDISKIDYYFPSDGWIPLEKLSGYNKFAVAPGDLPGKWSNNFGGFQQYVNVYTGASAGANTHSSTEVFHFTGGNSYSWSLNVASGFVGSIKFDNAKSTGTFQMPNNWQIQFSEIEKKSRLYNAYFSCVKGARILWLQDTGYGDYTGFGKEE